MFVAGAVFKLRTSLVPGKILASGGKSLVLSCLASTSVFLLVLCEDSAKCRKGIV